MAFLHKRAQGENASDGNRWNTQQQCVRERQSKRLHGLLGFLSLAPSAHPEEFEPENIVVDA